MDQCEHCVVQGQIEECYVKLLKTRLAKVKAQRDMLRELVDAASLAIDDPCTIHEAWYVGSLKTRLAEADTKIDMLREYLEKLSRLGNGDRPGNSIGNSMAQEAPAKLEDNK